jgi:hypothetical protein
LCGAWLTEQRVAVGVQDGEGGNPLEDTFGIGLRTKLVCEETKEEMQVGRWPAAGQLLVWWSHCRAACG